MDVVLIGLGNMGMAYAERLAATGHQVLGYDISATAVAALAERGGVALGSLGEVAGLGSSPVVLLSLPKAEVVERVVHDVVDVLAPGSIAGVVDMSTTGPVGARRVAQTLDAAGIAYAEAPVTGGVPGARNGSLTLMVSGSPSLLEAAEPALRDLGTVRRLGDAPGLGQSMKVLNNLLSATSLAITSEALAAGVAVGLDPAQMIEVFNSGSGKNGATMDKFDRYVLSGSFDQGFALPLMAKDVGLAQELLHDVGLPAWVSAAVLETWLAACRLLPHGADFTELPRLHASYLFGDAARSTSIYGDRI